jgi:small subunit ribosomal protein S17
MADQQTTEQRATERAARKQKNAKARRAYRAKQKEKRAAARGTADAAPAEATEAREHGPGRPKVRQGVVVSAKPDKTITVRIDVTRRHRVYKKIVRSSSTLHVHDERNDANEGDLVRVVESRPISRLKRWRLVEVLERSR